MISSVNPSLKDWFSPSGLRFVKGSTAIEGADRAVAADAFLSSRTIPLVER